MAAFRFARLSLGFAQALARAKPAYREGPQGPEKGELRCPNTFINCKVYKRQKLRLNGDKWRVTTSSANS